MIKIFKAEQWNLDILLPLFEEYRLSHGMAENPERTLTFLTNRIRFSESIFFLALDEDKKAVGFIQLYPRLSSLQLQRYWQLTDIFVRNMVVRVDRGGDTGDLRDRQRQTPAQLPVEFARLGAGVLRRHRLLSL